MVVKEDYQKSDKMSDKVSQAICSLIKESISDERSAPSMYRKLKDMLNDSGSLTRFDESRLGMIINDEENHEKYLMGLAISKGCGLSQKGKEEERYYKKSLSERIALAKKIVAGMGR